MNPQQAAAFEEWLVGRPSSVVALARKYPPGTRFRIHGRVMHVISYDEHEEGDAGLLLTPVDPAVDFERALAERQPVCPCCIDKLEYARIHTGCPRCGHRLAAVIPLDPQNPMKSLGGVIHCIKCGWSKPLDDDD